MPHDHDLRGRLDLLVPLGALLETASVTAAARRMGVTQPAMSRILERLRTAFGDPLLVRVGAQMQVTPKAAALQEPLRQLLSAAQSLYAPTEFDPRRAQRTFRTIIPDVVAATLLPQLLSRLALEAPRCRLHLVPWGVQLDAQESIAFAISTEAASFPSFRREPLYRDRDVLAGRTRPRRGTDPLELDHVAVIPAGLHEDPVDRWLAAIGRERRIVTVVPSYMLAVQAVARAGLYAILPSRTVAALGPPLGIKAYELPLDQDDDQQWLLYPPRLEVDPPSCWLRSLVIDVCNSAA